MRENRIIAATGNFIKHVRRGGWRILFDSQARQQYVIREQPKNKFSRQHPIPPKIFSANRDSQTRASWITIAVYFFIVAFFGYCY